MHISNPLRAREWFGWKQKIHIAFCAITCGTPAFLLIYFGHPLGALIFVPSAFVLFVWLEGRPITIACPQCNKYIDINKTPWECGYKGCANHKAYAFPFINMCEHCLQEPKAYECHHCKANERQTLIYLSPDSQNAYFAKHLSSSKLVPVIPVDPTAEKIAQQEAEIRDLEHKFQRTKITTDIKIEKKRGMTQKEQSAFDSLKDEYDRLMTADTLEETVIDHFERECKKNFAGNEEFINKYLARLNKIAQARWEKKGSGGK